MVCGTKDLSVSVEDLAKNGKLLLEMRGDAFDSGEVKSWESGFTMASFIYEGRPWPGATQSQFIIDCQSKREKSLGRSLSFQWQDSQWLTLRLPEKDTLTPQPRQERQDLYIQKSISKTNPLLSETAESVSERTLRDHELMRAGEAEGQHMKKQIGQTIEKFDDNDNFVISKWQVHPRGSFMMAGSFFKGKASAPGNGMNICRYHYDSLVQEAQTIGELECRDVPGYKWIYVQLNCLKELKL
jgi:hypothetical protein